METASIQFIFFGLATAFASNLRRSSSWRLNILLLSSLLFLLIVARTPTALLPLAVFLMVGYIGLALITHGRRQLYRFFVVGTLLSFLVLKKYAFLPKWALINSLYLTLGISYIFFRILHLLIEYSDGPARPPVRLDHYLAYTLNFTTFVSGPIQRYEQFAREQFAEIPIGLDTRTIGEQLERIVFGLFKVCVVALIFHMIHVDALAEMRQQVPMTSKMYAAFELAISYPFFLYNNFSGYIDIVIAIARLLRLDLPENFNRPFSATSFLDFWNRWHITLSTWLKTYVYNPLLILLARRTTSAVLQEYFGVASFFVTFFLVGIWHGGTSEFVVFGVLQGAGVAGNKLWQIGLTRSLGRKPYKSMAAGYIYTVAARGLTFTWFGFTLFWFWASWVQLDEVFGALPIGAWLSIWFFVWISASMVLAGWEAFRASVLSGHIAVLKFLKHRYVRLIYSTTFAAFAFVIIVILDQPAPGIVYKAF